jgi:hypothetical protein
MIFLHRALFSYENINKKGYGTYPFLYAFMPV